MTCPSCGAGISQPFARTSGPIVYVHHNKTRVRTGRNGERRKVDCRLIVWPDPLGIRHRIWTVAANTSLEEALTEAVTAARGGGWMLTQRSTSREALRHGR